MWKAGGVFFPEGVICELPDGFVKLVFRLLGGFGSVLGSFYLALHILLAVPFL